MRSTFCLALAAILTVCATQAVAADIDTIIVTASRTAETQDESLASVTVITREDIERLQAQSLQDLLRGVPGLTLSNNGGAGKTTSLFMRGTESDHVLVILDGIRLGSATSGTAPIQDLPIDQIERIEIVRGPRSSLYGSEAIGGVVQIFTRRGGGDLKGRFSLDLGSYGSRGGAVGISGGGEHSWFSADLALRDTDGFDARPKSTEPDDDGYRNESATLRAGHRFDNGLEVDLHALSTKGESEFDGSFVNESETRQQVLGGSLHFAPTEAWLMNLTAGRTWDESDNFKDGLYMTTFDTERDTLSLQGDLDLGAERLLTLGFDYQEERVNSTSEFTVDERDNLGYFVQYQGAVSAHDLQLSLRQDDHEAFGRHTTGGLAWGYTIQPGLRLWAAYATAFKAPTFNELFYPGFGNPDLHPEESGSLELGLQIATDWADWSLSAYQTKVDELISYTPPDYIPVNIDQARIRGLEAQVDADIGAWRSAVSLTLLDPRNDSDGVNQDNLLPRRTRQSLRIDLDRSFGAYTLGATLLAEGKRYEDTANTQKLGGFGTLDLRASYRFNNNWLLRGRCENLFDKGYETVTNYNQPGRSFYLTLSYQS